MAQSNRSRIRWMVGGLVLAGVLLFAGANAHLVYVAFATQPDCVAHLKGPGTKAGQFRAAKSAC
ncbi:hypothetical protein [Aurantimonas sp. DM33-3]|uniref:hypothetical protein n=1 Tax=Aurantimonas sp. DM33-3 TaxID=2766955 RepID=UPI0016524966|nr:hypothetical protein [Aurantimonas sp. DM33-3]